nr:hypothetical protein NCPCFENI_01124 [Cupriavidus sp.]
MHDDRLQIQKRPQFGRRLISQGLSQPLELCLHLCDCVLKPGHLGIHLSFYQVSPGQVEPGRC